MMKSAQFYLAVLALLLWACAPAYSMMPRPTTPGVPAASTIGEDIESAADGEVNGDEVSQDDERWELYQPAEDYADDSSRNDVPSEEPEEIEIEATPPSSNFLDEDKEAELAEEIGTALDHGDYHAALAAVSRALLYTDDDAKKSEIYATRGLIYHYMDNNENALEDMARAIRLNPTDTLPYETRATIYFFMDEPGLAMLDLEKAIELGAEDPLTYTQLGNLLIDFNNLPAAIRMYDAALERQPDYLEAIFQRGYVYAQLGYLHHAEADFNLVIAEMPDEAFTYNSRGIVHAQAGRMDLALDDFKTAAELDPELSSALSNLGYAYFVAGDMEAALDAYDRADDIEKNDPYTLCNRVETYVHAGEMVKARGTLKKCLKAAGDDEDFSRDEAHYLTTLRQLKKLLDKGSLPSFEELMQKGHELLDENNRLGAYKAFSMAYILNPSDADANFQLGRCCALLGQRFYALQFLNRALILSPDSNFADEAQQLIQSVTPEIDD